MKIAPDNKTRIATGSSLFDDTTGAERSYFHLELQVTSLDSAGNWSCNGKFQVFSMELLKGEDGIGYSSTEDVMRQYGYILEDLESIPGTGSLQGQVKMIALTMADPNAPQPNLLPDAISCKQVRLQRAFYYEKVGLLHRTYSFEQAQFAHSDATTSFSPLDRLALRLEVDCTEISPKRTIRFVARPPDRFSETWASLIPGVAILFHKPVNVTITRPLSREWMLGADPKHVHGVDFSGTFSKGPVYALPIQRRAEPWQRRAIWPSLVLGCLATMSLSSPWLNISSTDVGLKLAVAFPAVLAAVGMIILRTARWHSVSTPSWFLDIYFVLTLGFCLANAVVGVLLLGKEHGSQHVAMTNSTGHHDIDDEDDEEPKHKDLMWVVLGVWIACNIGLLSLMKSTFFRGSWHRVSTRSKGASARRPDLSEALTHPGENKHKIIPVITEHSLENHAKSKPKTDEQRAHAKEGKEFAHQAISN